MNAVAELDAETTELLDDVFQAYSDYSMSELTGMIKKESPWKDARRGLPAWDLTKRPINKTTMAHFYKTALDAEQAGTASRETTRPARSSMAG